MKFFGGGRRGKSPAVYALDVVSATGDIIFKVDTAIVQASANCILSVPHTLTSRLYPNLHALDVM